MADRINAEQVHQYMIKVLEKLATLKTNKSLYEAVTKFVVETESLIDHASRGNDKVLDEARSNIRWMEALYHSAPQTVRNTQDILAALRPATGWRKYTDMFLDKVVFFIIGAVGSWAVFHFILHTV
jgi:hypothetical protein